MKILNSILYFFLAFGALILITGVIFKILHLAIGIYRKWVVTDWVTGLRGYIGFSYYQLTYSYY